MHGASSNVAETVRTMNIRSRVWIFQTIAVAAVVTMAAATFVGVQAANDYLSRVQFSRQQLDTATQLAINANRFSEQIAELLLIGEPERSEFEAARDQTSAVIGELRRITLLEIEAVQDPVEKAEQQDELARVTQMRALFREIDRAVERVLLLAQQGREDAAIALFRSDIENRLDADFERLIVEFVADERAEVAEADSRAKILSKQLLNGTLLLLGFLVATAVVSGLLFARSLKAPLTELAEGALAVERGNLDRKIAYSKRDEFGFLAQRFNTMVGELRRQRQALIEAQVHLEHQVSERTSELAHANRQLTDLDQQRVKFLADVGHELKTPLTVLRGEAEVTLRGTLTPEATYRTALINIVTQAKDMGRLVDDLLFLARTEEDEVRYDFRAVALSRLIEGAIQDVSVLVQDRAMKISVNDEANGTVVRGDPRRLKQAVLIVLDNAIKYTSTDSEIGVALRAMNGHVTISVRNEGPPIDPNDLPHVFERFYRGANASPTGHGGSGLGLAIARSIVDRHDGHMDLSSDPVEGTEVRIRLPQMSRG